VQVGVVAKRLCHKHKVLEDGDDVHGHGNFIGDEFDAVREELLER
jgi:hypothetical protein